MSIFFYMLGVIEFLIGLFFVFGDNVPSFEAKSMVLMAAILAGGILIAIGAFLSESRKR